MEDSQKKLLLFGASAIGTAVAGFLLYKLFSREEGEEGKSGKSGVSELISQSLSQSKKEELALELLKKATQKYGPIRTSKDGVILKEDFLFIMRQIDQYANVLLYDIRQ